MPSRLSTLIAERIRARGPITVADYVELALYHPQHGYYACREQRSGRGGDFLTSVDVGPIFGELLAAQLGAMRHALEEPSPSPAGAPFDLVEAAAGNGRLSRDILDAAGEEDPELLEAVRLHLVERSPAARAAQAAVLGAHAGRLVTAGEQLPARVHGVILANELLDALPPHLVVMRDEGLREVFVDQAGGTLVTREMPPSSPALERYLERVGAHLQPGWHAEIGLAAAAWVRDAARRLERGYLLLIDYGFEARELYSAARPAGTLVSIRDHVAEARAAGPGWLAEAGGRDLTFHVDLTAIRLAAEAEGLTALSIQDQTHFLLGLGLDERLGRTRGDARSDLRRRLALKTLLLPGGLGGSHTVMIFARGVGQPGLPPRSRWPPGSSRPVIPAADPVK